MQGEIKEPVYVSETVKIKPLLHDETAGTPIVWGAGIGAKRPA